MPIHAYIYIYMPIQARSYHYAKKRGLAHKFVKIHIFQTPYGWIIVKKCHFLFLLLCNVNF